MDETSQKIFFVQKINEEEFEIESIWCIKKGENYVIDNIPFVAKRVSLGDIIKAEYDDNDKVYYFDDFVEVSGNSTIRLYCKNVSIIQKVRGDLKLYKCESEAFLERNIVAVNVPKEVDYKPMREFFETGEKNDLWVYEESCLAHTY